MKNRVWLENKSMIELEIKMYRHKNLIAIIVNVHVVATYTHTHTLMHTHRQTCVAFVCWVSWKAHVCISPYIGTY